MIVGITRRTVVSVADDPTNALEELYDDLAATAPKFLGQLDDARRTPLGVAKLHNTYRTALRGWIGMALASIAAVPLIVFLAWRSSWWLLLALVLTPPTFYIASTFGMISHRRIELLRPLAVEETQTFLADAAQRIAAKATRSP